MEWRQGATGETVFVKFEPSLSRIRAACGRALRDRRKPRKFAIAYENLYYGNLLSATLAREAELSALVQELKPRMTSEAEGVWQCAALLQADTNDGILLHGDEERLWCAYLPLRTRAQVMEAHEIAARLSRLAQSADGVLLPMEEQILRAGTYSLKEILTALAERGDS